MHKLRSPVIDITQYRAAIGCWHSVICAGYVAVHTNLQTDDIFTLAYINVLCFLASSTFSQRPVYYLLVLLLLACGDIHPNPGPINNNIKGIHMCQINARSLFKPGRLDEIYLELCCLHQFDIIAVSESHLSGSIPDCDVNIPKYNLFRGDRNRDGGGVALYVNDSFNCIRRPDLENRDMEMLWVELKLGSYRILLGVCYRPPNQSSDQIESFIELLSDTLYAIPSRPNQSLILMGDFNDRCTSWDSDHSDSELGLKLVNLVSSLNMSQLITKPTRNTKLLDLLITDSPDYFTDVDVLPVIDNLDHRIIHGTFAVTRPKMHNFTRKVWQYDQGNFDHLNNLLFLTDWDEFFAASANISTLTENLTSLLLSMAETCIPTKTVTLRPRDKPGMTSEIRKMFKVARHLHKRAKRTANPVDIELFRNARREAKSAFRKSRTKYFSDISEKLLDRTTCTKTYWKLTKMVYGSKVVKGIPDMSSNGSNISDTHEKATLFNQYFSEQCSLPPGSDVDPLPDFKLLTQSTLDSISTSPEEIRKILLNLNTSKASGPDGISNKILKECAHSLCSPLARLFNLSFQFGIFPNSWKLANVVPIYKKNDRQLVSNYRPVSLLSTLSKVMERIVHSRLYDYCVENNLLTDKNSGFKRGDSTVNQLTHLTNKITEALDKRKDVCLVFLDITKAFDKVWHKGLLFKLRQLSLSNVILKWFSSYLLNRRQQVIIDGVSSSELFITAGVPQGSILGPLLFLIYINDLVEDLKCDPHLFADDTLLFDVFSNPLASAARINSDLKIIIDWGTIWKVIFNPAKTFFMVVSNKLTPMDFPPLVFNNTAIVKTNSHKHLGLIITDKFVWKDHIDSVLVKASRCIHLINSVKHLLPRRALCSLYKTMVLPIIEYCDVIYDNCTIKHSLALENTQRRAALVCTGAYRHTSNDSLLAELGWQPLRVRRQIHKLCLFYKIYNSLTPEYLHHWIPEPVVNQYRLRSTTNAALLIPYSRLSSTRSAFVHSTVKLWNSLDINIRSVDSLNLFKNKVANHCNRHFNPRFIPSLYLFNLPGTAAVHHCRIRLGLSALNFHRFKYNFIDDKACPKCNFSREDTSHLLFNCPAYADPRAVLMENLKNCLPQSIISNRSLLENALIFGSVDLDLHTNLVIFQHVYRFLDATGRFNN